MVHCGLAGVIQAVRSWFREHSVKSQKTATAWTWRPPRVRYEPPTLEEAMAAAQGMTSDHDQQVEIAASLLGLSVDAVRAESPATPETTQVVQLRTRSALSGRTVVVERKVRRISAASGRR